MADAEMMFTDPANYVNRELSWLEFDFRSPGGSPGPEYSPV